MQEKIRICQSELPVSKKENRGQRSFYKTDSEEGDRDFVSVLHQVKKNNETWESAKNRIYSGLTRMRSDRARCKS